MSISFKANYYARGNSRCRDASIHVSENGLLTTSLPDTRPVSIQDVSVSSRIGASARFLTLPNGDKIETRNNEAVDALSERWFSPRRGIAHRLESNIPVVIIALLLLIAGTWLFVVEGIPALAKRVTAALPVALDDRLGAEVLEQLDDFIFAPSSLPDESQYELTLLFNSLIPDRQRDFAIAFRDGDFIGANAFALPNAQIVFTDQLIELSDYDEDMLAAVMLHEIGHVVNRHSMQAVVAQSGVSMLTFALTGDINSAATTLIVLLPSFMIQSSYSRDFEWEADTYALERMQALGMDSNQFADIMERLISQFGETRQSDTVGSTNPEENTWFEYFSSHPATQQRIERFRDASYNRSDSN